MNSGAKGKKNKSKGKSGQKRPSDESEDKFDFGGIPKNLDLKKNLGCGG